MMLSLDLMPETGLRALETRLEAQSRLGRAPEELLTGIFHRRVGEALFRAAGARLPPPWPGL